MNDDLRCRLVATRLFTDLADIGFDVSERVLRELVEKVEREHPSSLGLDNPELLRVPITTIPYFLAQQKSDARRQLARELQSILSPAFQRLCEAIASRLMFE